MKLPGMLATLGNVGCSSGYFTSSPAFLMHSRKVADDTNAWATADSYWAWPSSASSSPAFVVLWGMSQQDGPYHSLALSLTICLGLCFSSFLCNSVSNRYIFRKMKARNCSSSCLISSGLSPIYPVSARSEMQLKSSVQFFIPSWYFLSREFPFKTHFCLFYCHSQWWDIVTISFFLAEAIFIRSFPLYSCMFLLRVKTFVALMAALTNSVTIPTFRFYWLLATIVVTVLQGIRGFISELIFAGHLQR